MEKSPLEGLGRLAKGIFRLKPAPNPVDTAQRLQEETGRFIEETRAFWQEISMNFAAASLYDLTSPLGEFNGLALVPMNGIMRVSYNENVDKTGKKSMTVECFKPIDSVPPERLQKMLEYAAQDLTSKHALDGIRENSAYSDRYEITEINGQLQIGIQHSQYVQDPDSRQIVEEPVYQMHTTLLEDESAVEVTVNGGTPAPITSSQINEIRETLCNLTLAYEATASDPFHDDPNIFRPISFEKAKSIFGPERREYRKKVLGALYSTIAIDLRLTRKEWEKLSSKPGFPMSPEEVEQEKKLIARLKELERIYGEQNDLLRLISEEEFDSIFIEPRQELHALVKLAILDGQN